MSAAESGVQEAAPARREVWLLAGMMLMLPLFEAPKNLLWLAFLAVWAGQGWQRRDFGGPWRGWLSWDGVVLASLMLALLGTALAGLKGNEWVGVRDLFRYLPILWVLSRSEYSQRQWLLILASLVTGTLLALAWGSWVWWRSGAAELGLHSVGHSNHSATFLCIVFGVSVSLALHLHGAFGLPRRRLQIGLAWLAAGLLALGVVATGSRIGLAITVALAFLLPCALALKPGGQRRPLLGVLVAGVLCAVLIAVSQPWVLRKHQRNVSDNNVLAYRDALWAQALTAWRAHPVFGVGMDNFSQVDLARLNAWERDQGRPLSPPGTYQSVHAHSLYLDALAERGLVGVASLAALIACWAAALWRRRPQAGGTSDFLPWGAAFGAAVATLGVGLVNTTLHTELALAAMVCLGALVGVRMPGRHPGRSGDQ